MSILGQTSAVIFLVIAESYTYVIALYGVVFVELLCDKVADADGCFRLDVDPATSLCAEIGGYAYDVDPSLTACRIRDPAFVTLWNH